MKYKVKITNLSFDIEFEKEGSVIDPPIIDPPIVIPPSNGFKNIQKAWDDAMSNPNVFQFIVDGKCEIPVLKTNRINRKLKIKGINNAILKFGVEKYDKWSDPVKQEGVLFVLLDGAEVVIEDVNICQPPQITTNTEPYRPSIFRSEPDPNHKWTAVVKNCDTTILGRNGGFGLGFVYGGIHENHIAAINFKHAGSTFIDGKAAIGGSKDTILYITLDNVFTDDPNPEEFASWKVPVVGNIKDGIFTITSEETVNYIKDSTFSDENVGNAAHIIHIGRFTFMLKPSNVLDLKRIKLYPRAEGRIPIIVRRGKVFTCSHVGQPLIKYEGHAGDSFMLNGVKYTTIEKHREDHPHWTNNWKPNEDPTSYVPFLTIDKLIPDGEYFVDWTSTFNLEGITQKAYMIYKSSSYSWRSFIDTPFEYWEILYGDVVGHTMYNHRNISLWAKDTTMNGYYRQTDPGGRTLGYNMINCKGFEGQFNPPVPITTDQPMPDRIKKLL